MGFLLFLGTSMQNRQAFFFLLVLWFMAVGPASYAEIALPSEPVGNATDRALAEKKARRAKGAKAGQAAKEKAHRLAHRKHKKHRVTRKTAQAEGTQP